ncbi:MAG: hypothetical protein LLG04_16885 [Parachlamydia sp.]|nr:hypothetical protein [Parachlamydia sp.]
MVKGLNYFKTHFASYAEHYVLIGGTACTVIMQEVGLDFRATKDLDIVLYIEALTPEFVTAFWEFVKAGGYQNRQQSTGKEIFYRFYSPSVRDFPAMLELFSRLPDSVKLSNGNHLTPIPINEAVTSLSAILLDDGYYQFIHSGKQQVDGLSLLGASHLIPLKARAWLDLNDRRNVGAEIDEKDIRKHKNDIIRLYPLLTPAQRIILPQQIKQDMQVFLDRIATDNTIDLNNLGLKRISVEELLGNLRRVYGIDV